MHFSQEYVLQNVVCKLSAILFWHWCVRNNNTIYQLKLMWFCKSRVCVCVRACVCVSVSVCVCVSVRERIISEFSIGNLPWHIVEWYCMFPFDLWRRYSPWNSPEEIVLLFALIPWWRHQMETISASLAFVRWIHRSPVDFHHKGQWRGALMSSLICAWTNGWANNRDAGDLRRHRAHYDVTVMRPLVDMNCLRLRHG